MGLASQINGINAQLEALKARIGKLEAEKEDMNDRLVRQELHLPTPAQKKTKAA